MSTAAPSTKQRVDWADTGRGIAIVLVTLYHAAQWLDSAGYPLMGWIHANELFASLRLPLFFTLAGLFAKKWIDGEWGALWRSKLSLFFWVFMVWETIETLTFNMGLLTQEKCCAVGSLARGLLLAPVLPEYELWFIWALGIFFIVAKLLRRVDFRIQMVFSGVLAAFALTGWETIMNTGWAGLAKFYFFFLIGVYLRKQLLRLGSTGGPLFILGSLVLWGGLSAVFVFLNLETIPGVYLVNCVAGLIGGIALSRVLAFIGPLRRVGARTLPVYVTHTPFILIVNLVLWLTPVHAFALPFTVLLPPIVTAIAVVLSVLLYKWLSRTKYLRYLYTQPPIVEHGARRGGTRPQAAKVSA